MTAARNPWPSEAPPRRGMPYITPGEGMTPREMEQLLGELYNEHIRSEMERRKLNEHLLDCVLAYERAFVSATLDPECPRPRVNVITVGERDAWIRGMVIEEWEAMEMAKNNLENQDRYIRTLIDNTSKMQSSARLILSGYDLPGSRVGAGSSAQW